ncbi:glycine-rich domain-containing protein [Kiloniella sp. b19]|uniref:glycine-rich domain-containing protein n=1 Tax=Kiloniella sp. GXU_MW_B19 TaxID=3141326 RepID=UPI0031DAD42A
MICQADVIESIAGLDFEWIERKLTKTDPNIAREWTSEGVRDAISQYRNFMFLLYKYSETHRLVPSIEVDEIWHHHILDTRKYFEDCEKVYGRYMHHFPYFGMRGEEDFANLQRSFESTQKLYFQHFEEYMYEVDF